MLRRFLRAASRRTPTAFLVALFLVIAATSAAAYALLPPTPAATETATVKIVVHNGHGSGVHIGDGFIVTAAHLVGDAKEVQLKQKGGALRKADVLWVNKANDIALLRTSSAGIGVAKLACRAVNAGDPIVAYGNPLKIEFVAAYGKIAGDPRETEPWKSVYVTDITTVMGQSGGQSTRTTAT